MSFNFLKIHAAGNDFVVIDSVGKNYKEFSKPEIIKICNRKTGIGCDQLLIMKDSKIADAEMVIYNSDGSKAFACGNGARCIAFLYMNKLKTTSMRLQVSERTLDAKIHNGEVFVDMGKINIDEKNTKKLQTIQNNSIVLNIGNNHAVIFVENFQNNEFIVNNINKIFPDGINIELVKIIDESNIKVTVFERGVGETLSCGSGACAAAFASVKNMRCSKNLNVEMKGGILRVNVSDTIELSGKVSFVFEGKMSYIP